ncbi:helix-turn-helix domain-containing protein [Bdellovibrio bacteriovorus]|uniref:helix-turn-helix domain-containing protein n=1 Tax=Bdellovibrio bacteriovorus TaxID=959 RepID=UPI0035A6EEB0
MRVGTPGFIPERLKEAREARGFSVTQLAELLSISKQSISSYERGDSTPSPEVINVLSTRLNFPKMFFLSSPERYDLNPVFYRSIASATKTSRDMAKWKLRWFKDIIHYLKQYIVLPAHQLPNFSDLDIASLSDAEIEGIAVETRKAWGIGLGAISNPTLLLESKGIFIARGLFSTSSMDALSEWDQKLDIPMILLSSDKGNPFRSRFDLCHELGHLILHRNVSQEFINSPAHFKLIEHQAHRFSSAFLLPEESFARDIRRFSVDSFLDLKGKWRVSAKAMIKRCSDLGMVSEEQEKQLFVSYSKRGYNSKGEPGDFSESLEMPRFAKRCFEGLAERGIQTPDDILANLNVPKEHICELANLTDSFFKSKEQLNLEFIMNDFPSNVVPLRRG